MTAERRMIIKCDGPCGAEISLPAGMMSTCGRARKYLKGIGWTYIGDKDYCPSCKVVKP